MARTLLIFAGIILAVVPVLQAENIYVCQREGEDIPREEQTQNCFYSIQEALNSASPGDTIRISRGTYYENLTLENFGAEGLWTTIKAKESGAVIVDGSRSDAAALVVKNSRYLRVDGLQFRNAGRYGLAFFDSAYGVAQNCRASNNSWEGFLAFHSAHIDFINCVGNDNHGDSFNYNNAADSLMKGCIQFRGGNGLSVEQGSRNIKVEQNIFHDNWADGILVYTGCENIEIQNNIIYLVHDRDPKDNGQGHCIKVTHGNKNVRISENQAGKCTGAFVYDIAGNTQIRYENNVLAEIGARIPAIPRKSWEGDVLFKGPGDYPEFFKCGWFNAQDIQAKGWGFGNRLDESLIMVLDRKIRELKAQEVNIGKNENFAD